MLVLFSRDFRNFAKILTWDEDPFSSSIRNNEHEEKAQSCLHPVGTLGRCGASLGGFYGNGFG